MFSNWKVLYTHPRAEKAVAADCAALGLECYLPLRTATRVYQRRKVTFQTPLFPGYIFVGLAPEKKYQLFDRGHVVHVLPTPRPVAMLRQVVMVRKALRQDPGLEATDPVTEGEIVRVATGAMMGCEGVVTRISRKSSTVVLTINVDIIGKAVPVQVERAMIERLVDTRTRKHRHV